MTDHNNLFQVEFFVYISGVRVPETRIDITSSFNAFPVCTITMPPDINLVGIGRRDRIPMQVFMTDTLKTPIGDNLDPDLLLLFEGEVTGFSYQSTELGKELTVTGEAIPAFIRDVYVRILTSFDDVMMSHGTGNQTAADTNPHLMYFPASLFLGGITGGSSDRIKYPYQFLENAIKFLTGELAPDSSSRSPLLKFYGDYCTKLKMGNRYTKVPFFDSGSYFGTEGFPILKGLGDEALNAIFNNMGSQAPVQESIYNMINYIVSSMEFEWAIFSSPAYIGGNMITTCLKPIFYEAVPPPCNYLFKSMVKSITMQEKVSGIPTRVMMRDVHSAKTRFFNSPDSEMPGLAALQFSSWPTGNNQGSLAEGYSELSSELITDPRHMSEEFCGPRFFETTAPPWMTYLAKEAVVETRQAVALNIFKHIYYLKQYEYRQMSVNGAFNPYITAGFPAVVYDFDTPGQEAAEGNGFIGQVTVVHHVITKQTMATDIQMGFTRTLAEEANQPIPATMQQVTDLVQDAGNMATIYAAIIDPLKLALPVGALISGDAFSGELNPHSSPCDAYKYTSRNITTREQYLDFMEAGLDADGNITGGRDGYFTSRWDSTTINSLKTAVFNTQTIRNVFA